MKHELGTVKDQENSEGNSEKIEIVQLRKELEPYMAILEKTEDRTDFYSLQGRLASAKAIIKILDRWKVSLPPEKLEEIVYKNQYGSRMKAAERLLRQSEALLNAIDSVKKSDNTD